MSIPSSELALLWNSLLFPYHRPLPFFSNVCSCGLRIFSFEACGYKCCGGFPIRRTIDNVFTLYRSGNSRIATEALDPAKRTEGDDQQGTESSCLSSYINTILSNSFLLHFSFEKKAYLSHLIQPPFPSPSSVFIKHLIRNVRISRPRQSFSGAWVATTQFIAAARS